MPVPNRLHESAPVTVTWVDTGPAELPVLTEINGRKATPGDQAAYERAILDSRQSSAALLAGVCGTRGERAR